MTPEQWADMARTLLKVVDDVRENRAPPAPPASASGLADTLELINANLPAIITTLRAYRGEVTGAADLFSYLERVGVPHAGDIRTAILSVPGWAEKADSWIGWIIFVLNETKPAAIGIPGGFAGSRGHV